MGAYNWIDVEASCPACGELTTIHCQTHVASSFDGDESGCFCHRTYRLGERMAWGDDDGWKEDGEPRENASECAEACYSECTACHAALVVVIVFRAVTPVEVVYVRPEAEWPAGYPR